MGKYIVLVTLAAAVTFAILMGQSRSTAHKTTEEQVDRQEEILSRQIARSGFNLGLSEVRQTLEDPTDETFDLPGTNTSDGAAEDEYDGGRYTLRISSTDPADVPVTLTAVGDYEGTQYKIAGVVEQIDGLFGALTIDGAPSRVERDGKAGGGPNPDTGVISGLNEGSGADRHGVRISDAEAADNASQDDNDGGLCASNKNQVNVEGLGRERCDVGHRSDMDTASLQEAVEELASSNKAVDGKNTICDGDDVGTEDEPAVVRVDGNCKMSGNTTGTGILYVTGEVEMEETELLGTVSWNGLIFVDGVQDGEGGGAFKTAAGTPTINGSIVQVGDSPMEFNGNPTVQYDSDQLLNLIGPDLLDRDLIVTPRITARGEDFCDDPGNCPSADALLNR